MEDFKEEWRKIDWSRTSGLTDISDGGPLDDAMRDGQWCPELQHPMPVAGGLPGSRGIRQEWKYKEPEPMQHMMPIRTDFSWRLDKKHSGLNLSEISSEGNLFEYHGKSGNFDFDGKVQH